MLSSAMKKAVQLTRQGAYSTEDFVNIVMSSEELQRQDERTQANIFRLANLVMGLARDGKFDLRKM